MTAAQSIPSVPRSRSHLRRITCEGFRRDDGLFDIEGTLIDTKPDPAPLPHKVVPADEPIHHLMVRLTIDRDLLIHDARAFALDVPYPDCSQAPEAYRQLIGQRIGPGFRQAARELFRGVRGCSHLTELLQPIATTAYQTLWRDRPMTQASTPLGGCHALRLDGDIVRVYFPAEYRALPAGQVPDA